MGRSPCCDEVGVKKGPWTPEEDQKLVEYIQKHGHGSWRHLPNSAGLNRCGKSCRLRWTNYLRPDIKRGKFTEDEDRLIIHLHSMLGNKWSLISSKLPGRTDNEIKNYWNTHLKKKLLMMGIDPVTHQRRADLELLANLPSLLAPSNSGSGAANTWDGALRFQADAAQVARMQILQGVLRALVASSPSTSITYPSLDTVNSLLGSSLAPLRNLTDMLQLSRQLEALSNGSLALHRDLNQMASSGIMEGAVALQTPSGYHAFPPQDAENQGQNLLFHSDNKSLAVDDSTPSLVSASPESTSVDQKQDQMNTNEFSASNSAMSTQFDAWDALNPGDPDACELGWKDILEQISW
ncbi:hypothetical protein HPP92_002942 [Vanilla planifolia]|uniref:Uncharacterized protein n=1 Tax=Vanilla planifolia TaxID=51239 RepID=A0A835VMT7_VANPL|nr:hypothetical protein HPP92_002942 [Vanilla planifolia]